MKSLDHDRPVTPPHHPTAGVSITREEIECIGQHAFPGHQIVSLMQIQSGKSYNNRIYFLTLQDGEQQRRLVLKVNGRLWGASKVSNEVACLHLLSKHCPTIPVPEVVGWSEDGLEAIFSTGSGGKRTLVAPVGSSHGGWILMTALPGRPLADLDLDENTLTSVSRQLGDIVACWRKSIPAQLECGNISLGPDASLRIRHNIQDGMYFDGPVTSSGEFEQVKLNKNIEKLKTDATYAPNRHLVKELDTFVAEDLPSLSLAVDDPESFVFTHYDLSPRNVLVAGQPPHITGIVDFEFSGFYPAVDEFLSGFFHTKTDWPGSSYGIFMDQLAKNEIATPGRGFDKEMWDRNVCVERLCLNITPWWLPGDLATEEVSAELNEAEVVVRDMLKKLRDIKETNDGRD